MTDPTTGSTPTTVPTAPRPKGTGRLITVDGARHARIWGVMGFSTEFWKLEVWRALAFESKEGFLEGFLEPYFTAMDPNALLAMAWKWQQGDVSREEHEALIQFLYLAPTGLVQASLDGAIAMMNRRFSGLFDRSGRSASGHAYPK